MESPIKSKRLIELYHLVLANPVSLDIVCKLENKERIIVDILNS